MVNLKYLIDFYHWKGGAVWAYISVVHTSADKKLLLLLET